MQQANFSTEVVQVDHGFYQCLLHLYFVVLVCSLCINKARFLSDTHHVVHQLCCFPWCSSSWLHPSYPEDRALFSCLFCSFWPEGTGDRIESEEGGGKRKEKQNKLVC